MKFSSFRASPLVLRLLVVRREGNVRETGRRSLRPRGRCSSAARRVNTYEMPKGVEH